jgi:hypothetical protein
MRDERRRTKGEIDLAAFVSAKVNSAIKDTRLSIDIEWYRLVDVAIIIKVSHIGW